MVSGGGCPRYFKESGMVSGWAMILFPGKKQHAKTIITIIELKGLDVLMILSFLFLGFDSDTINEKSKEQVYG
jgi:hypothetical protein